MITDLFGGVTHADGRRADAAFSRSHSCAPTTDAGDGGLSAARDGTRAKRSQSIASLRRHHGGRGLSAQQHHAADVELFESCVAQVQRNLKAHMHNPSTLHILASYYTRTEPVIDSRPFCVSLSFATFLFHMQMARISLTDVEVYVQLVHHTLLQIGEQDMHQHPFVQQVVRDHVFGLPSPTCRGGAHAVVLVPTPQYRAYATLTMSLLALEAVPAEIVYAFHDRLEYYVNAASPMVSNRALALLVQGVSSSQVGEHVTALQAVLRRKSAKMNMDFLLACYERLKRAVVDVVHGPTFGRALSIYAGEIFLRFHSPIRRDYVERFLYPSLCHADMAAFLTIPHTRQYLLRELLSHCTPGLATANPFYLCLCALMQPSLNDETRGALAVVELIACRMPHAGYLMSALAIDAHMSVSMFAKVMLSLARGAGWAMTGRTEHSDAVASGMGASRTNVWNVLFVLREVVRSCSTTVSRRATEMLHALALALPPATVEALGKLASEAFAGYEAQLTLDPQRLCAELAMVLHQEHMAAAVEEAVGYLDEAATVCGYCGRQRCSMLLCPVNHTVHMSRAALDVMTQSNLNSSTNTTNTDSNPRSNGATDNNTSSLLSTLAECAGSRVLHERLIQYLRDPATQMNVGVHFLVYHILAHAGQHRRELYSVLEPYVRSTLLALVSADQQRYPSAATAAGRGNTNNHSTTADNCTANGTGGMHGGTSTRSLVSSEHKANVLMLHVKMTLLFAQTMDPSYVTSLLTVCAELTLRNTHDALALWYMSNLLLRHARGCMELLPADPQDCRYAVDFPGCAPESAAAADNAQRVLRLLDRAHHFSPAMRKLVGCCVCRLIQDFNMQAPNIVGALLSSHGFVPVGLSALAEFALPVGGGSTFWGFVMHQMRTSAPARTALMTALVKSIAMRFRIAAPAEAVCITGAEATAHVFAVMTYEAMKRSVALSRVVLYMMTQWMQQSGHTPGKFVCLFYLCVQLTVTVATRGSGASAVELSAETLPDRKGFGESVDKSIRALQRQQSRLARLAPAVRTESAPFYRLVRRLQRKARHVLALAEYSHRVDVLRKRGYPSNSYNTSHDDRDADNVDYRNSASSAADGVWCEQELADCASESSGDEEDDGNGDDAVFRAHAPTRHGGAVAPSAAQGEAEYDDGTSPFSGSNYRNRAGHDNHTRSNTNYMGANDEEVNDLWVVSEQEALRRVRVELGEGLSMSEWQCPEDDDVFADMDNGDEVDDGYDDMQDETHRTIHAGHANTTGDNAHASNAGDQTAASAAIEDDDAGHKATDDTEQLRDRPTTARAAKAVVGVVYDPLVAHEQRHQQEHLQNGGDAILEDGQQPTCGVHDEAGEGEIQTCLHDRHTTMERVTHPAPSSHEVETRSTLRLLTRSDQTHSATAVTETEAVGGDTIRDGKPYTMQDAALLHAVHPSEKAAWLKPSAVPKSVSMNILRTPRAHHHHVATNTSPLTVTHNNHTTTTTNTSLESMPDQAHHARTHAPMSSHQLDVTAPSSGPYGVDKAVTAPFEQSVGTSPTLPGEPQAAASAHTHSHKHAPAPAHAAQHTAPPPLPPLKQQQHHTPSELSSSFDYSSASVARALPDVNMRHSPPSVSSVDTAHSPSGHTDDLQRKNDHESHDNHALSAPENVARDVSGAAEDAARSIRGSTWYEPDLSMLFADGDTSPIDNVATPQLQTSMGVASTLHDHPCTAVQQPQTQQMQQRTAEDSDARQLPLSSTCAATVLPSSLVLEYLRTHQITDSLTHEIQQLNSNWMYQQVASYVPGGVKSVPGAALPTPYVMQTVAVESRPNNYAVPHRPETVPAPLASMQAHVRMQNIFPAAAAAATATSSSGTQSVVPTSQPPLQPSLSLRGHYPGSHYSCGNSSSFYRDSASTLVENSHSEHIPLGAIHNHSNSKSNTNVSHNDSTSHHHDMYPTRAEAHAAESRSDPSLSYSAHYTRAGCGSGSGSRGVTSNVVDGERPITPVSAEPVRDDDDDDENGNEEKERTVSSVAAEQESGYTGQDRSEAVTQGGHTQSRLQEMRHETFLPKRARVEEAQRVGVAVDCKPTSARGIRGSSLQRHNTHMHDHSERPPAQPIKRSAVQRGLEFFLVQGATSHVMSSVLQEVRRTQPGAEESQTDDVSLPGARTMSTRSTAAYASHTSSGSYAHHHVAQYDTNNYPGSTTAIAHNNNSCNNYNNNNNYCIEGEHSCVESDSTGANYTHTLPRNATTADGTRQTTGETLRADNVPVATPYGQVVIPACFIEQRNDTAVREIQQVMGNYNCNDLRLSGGAPLPGGGAGGGLASSGVRGGAMTQPGKVSMPAPRRSRNGRKSGRSTATRETEDARRSSSGQWWTELSVAPMPEYATDPQYSMELF